MEPKNVYARAAACVEDGLELSRFNEADELLFGQILDLSVTGRYATVKFEVWNIVSRLVFPNSPPACGVTHFLTPLSS